MTLIDEHHPAGQSAPDGTVAKALSLLDLLAAADGPMRFSDLLAAAPFPKATLHRMLRTLAAEGMVALDPVSHTYSLGPRLIRLAHAAWRRDGLAAAARPHLDRLRAEIDETFHLARLDGAQVLYLEKRPSSRAPSMFSSAGRVGPAWCTGVGKAMLAFLPADRLEDALSRQAFRRFTPATITDAEAMRAELAAIRARGHAYDREEHEPGIHCVAAPVIGPGGALYGALSVTGAKHLTPMAALEALAPRLRAAAAAIAADAEIAMAPPV